LFQISMDLQNLYLACCSAAEELAKINLLQVMLSTLDLRANNRTLTLRTRIAINLDATRHSKEQLIVPQT
ncbi:MAG: hypothetical protein EZS28_049260, partial [Streblomastix strix]